jgi:ATP-binding cassette subfamily B protein
MVLGILLEYLALSLMIPMGGGGQGLGLSVAQVWREFAVYAGLPDDPRVWIWLFLLTLGLRIFVGLIQVGLNSKISKLIHATLSSTSFSSVVSDVPLQDIYKHSVGYYMGLAGDDSIRIGQLFFSFLQLLSALLSAAIGLFALYLYSANVFVAIIIFLLCCSVILGTLAKGMLSLSSKSRDLSRDAASVFVDVLNGLRSIRSMTAEGYVNWKYRETLRRYTTILFEVDLYNHSSRTLPGLLLIAIG